MTRQERLDIGEKIFVGVFVGSIVIEVLLTLFAITLNPAWNTLLPWTILCSASCSSASSCYLANWLYSGNRTAWNAALGFAAFQIVLAVAVIVAMLANHRFAAYLGTPLIWLAIIKAVTYAAFAGFLSLPTTRATTSSACAAAKRLPKTRGGQGAPRRRSATRSPNSRPTTPSHVDPADRRSGGGVRLAGDVDAGRRRSADRGRVCCGCWSACTTSSRFSTSQKWLPGVPAVIEGFAAVLLGIYLFTPAAAVKRVQAATRICL